MRCIRKRAEAQFACGFVELMQRFADQGLNRKEAAKLIGCNHNTLYAVLADMNDPFPATRVAAAFVADTGESLGEFVRQKAAEGLFISEVARAVGYNNVTTFRLALKTRGIEVAFTPRHCRRTAAKLHALRASS